jgi:hypothetical protein
MNRRHVTAFFVLWAMPILAQSASNKQSTFDLSEIGMVVDGQQICEDKGRLQDVPSKEMERIIAGGMASIPILIKEVADSRELKTREPLICYWYGMANGDYAFALLSDLFTDTHDKTTLPGAGWDSMLGPAGTRAATVQLNDFIKKHGRLALQRKWQTLWNEYEARVFWDPKERCFKLKGTP